ncbi:MAG: ATP:cob(I)alamin adenosyltransferase [Candidatus Hydrogenedentes bacterium]|nr:ATP:cob(I)alamin adenosyltransferase [Candidatus Hydrogenedentota bacterium]
MSELKRSQVTTKRGDQGHTSTLGGDDVLKSHVIIDCTGAVDELRAQTALVRQAIQAVQPEDADSIDAFLLWLLHVYFVIGTACSDPEDKHPEYRAVELSQKHIETLENFQARLEGRVKLPKQFIVSASNPLAAQMDVVTTIARRLERCVVRVKEVYPEFRAESIFVFLNRLSDTLFMLARFLDGGAYQTVDYRVLD